MASIKSLLAGSPGLSTIPSTYTFAKNPKDEALLDDQQLQIPTVDFSLLTSADPDQRSKAVAELGKACEHWGFFMVINMSLIFDSCGF